MNALLVMRGSLVVAAIGVAIGLPLALLSAKLLRSILFGVEPRDPATFAAAIAGIAVVSVAASLIPALRAVSVDPMVALREEYLRGTCFSLSKLHHPSKAQSL